MAHPTSDKNFRLPAHTKPSRYEVQLSIHLEEKKFQGQARIHLNVGQKSRELVLHAIDLGISSAVFRRGERSLNAQPRVAVESETVVLELPEELEPGPGELHIQWNGAFNTGLRGLYSTAGVAMTQFEAADARRVFPCFDEPSFKARWALTLEVPKDAVALANGASVEETVQGDRKVIRFAETEVLSSYLVALACGDLASSPESRAGAIPVRTWCVPDKVGLTTFAQDVAVGVLPRLQDYFGLPYAFGKLDQLGVPDFEAGAMENAGLITYREVVLLVDSKTAPLAVQKRAAEVITHELAHQWFGNWVTMEWWDDLWLNEAFATWMAYLIVDEWRPEWRVWLDFEAGKAAALQLDALKSTHPIRSVVRNAAEATESFDVITYEKGGGVLRMIQGYIGPERFRDGIRAYMKRHACANATADDLWRALGEASGQPIIELANAWLGQSGFPLVSLSRRGHTVTVSQRRFYSEPGVSSDETWPVPLVLRYRDANGTHEHRQLMRGATETVELRAQGDISWVYGNAGSTGFYRVAYEPKELQALANDLGSLAPSERIGLVADLWAQVRAGKAELSSLLDLLCRFGDEKDYAVLDEVNARLAAVEYRLVPDDSLAPFRALVTKIFEPELKKLGWEGGSSEPDGVRLRRAALARAVAVIGRSSETTAALAERFARVLAGKRDALEPNLHDLAAHVAARRGDKALFDKLLEGYRTEVDPAFRRRYLLSLAAFEDPGLAARAQSMFFDGTVPAQDMANFAAGLLVSPTARGPFFEGLRQRWKDVTGRLESAPFILRRVVEGLGSLRERPELEALKAHLTAHPHDAYKQGAAQTLERVSQDVALRERALPEIAAWLRSMATK